MIRQEAGGEGTILPMSGTTTAPADVTIKGNSSSTTTVICLNTTVSLTTVRLVKYALELSQKLSLQSIIILRHRQGKQMINTQDFPCQQQSQIYSPQRRLPSACFCVFLETIKGTRQDRPYFR